jgi:hypothetical protein
MHSQSSVDHFFKGHSQGNRLPEQLFLAHFFCRTPSGAGEERIVYIPSGRSRATARDCPKTWPTKRPESGAQGLYKTLIYNILLGAGQTGHSKRKDNGPVSG